MDKFTQVAQFGQQLMAQADMENSLDLISAEAKKLLQADRCSIFIVDKEDGMLWTKLSDGIGRIVVSIHSGIVGHTYQTKEPQVVNKPYENEHFLNNIDRKSGYVTQNIIAVPIFDSHRDVIGVVQLLNKIDGEFSSEDLEVLTFFANYVSGSLELVLLNEKNG